MIGPSLTTKKSRAKPGFFIFFFFSYWLQEPIAKCLPCLFFHPLLAAGSALKPHLIGDRWLFECRASAEFPQDACAFVFLLKTPERAIDGLVILNYNTYHWLFIPPSEIF